MRRIAAPLVTVVTLAAALAGAGSAQADVRPGTYQQQAFSATNAHRADRGLRPLRRQDCVQRAAVRQARLMAQREQVFHQDVGAVLEECGLSRAAENVEYGYPSGRSVVDDGWMGSPRQRAHILDPRFRLLGIGARKGHDGRWYVAQVFGAKR